MTIETLTAAEFTELAPKVDANQKAMRKLPNGMPRESLRSAFPFPDVGNAESGRVEQYRLRRFVASLSNFPHAFKGAQTMNNFLISGDALDPSANDLIAQTKLLTVGKRVPEGWRVLSGNLTHSTIARVCYRYEAESGE